MKVYSLKSPGGTSGERILALDLGIGSYGIALQERNGQGEAREYSFPVVRSCTLPELWASLKEEGMRRRMYRTRQAHKARETWLRRVFEENGLAGAVLLGRTIGKDRVKQPDGSSRYVLERKGDYRLEREFPPRTGERTHDGAPSDAEGARTVYCGAALRCLLLLGEEAQLAAQGRVLEPWQLFKALHSAIQKRGYDPDIPWMSVHHATPAEDASAKPRKGKKATKAVVPGSEADEATAPVPSEEELQKHEEEQISRARAEAMQAIIEGNAPENPRCQHPCFWEAARMGLWDSEESERIRMRYDHHAQSTKWADRDDPAAKKKKDGEQPKADVHRMPAVYPRWMVERELLALCSAAEELLPQLAGKAGFIAYGPTEIPYPNIPRRDSGREDEEKKRVAALAALPTELREKFIRGKEREWDAALGQKAPTFDNRCLGDCALIPRFNVARVDIERDRKGVIVPDSLLAAEVSFLMQVKNFRFAPELKDKRDWLTPAEMRKLHADCFLTTVVPRMEAPGLKGAITKSDMCTWLATNIEKNRTPKPGQDKKTKDEIIEKPRTSGRARLSRPALRIVRALLLSGLPPKEFKERLLNLGNAQEEIIEGAGTWGALRKAVKLITLEGALNTDEKKGLTLKDTGFLDNIGASWEKLSIRDERLEAFSALADADQTARDGAIKNLISAEINPRIRHRLTLLDKILTEGFMSEDRRPDRVVIEFAREEFMGAKSEKKSALMKFQNERRDERLKARETLGADASERTILKHQLYEEQKRRCLFCGGNFSHPQTTSVVQGELSFENAHLAHIVADTKGGPRAYMNLVLACNACNTAQSNLYHATAFEQGKFSRKWDSFVEDVRGCGAMRPFKKKLLTTKSETEAAEMVQNRNALQQTAWIAKLARTLICLKFGWPLDFEGQAKRIVVVTGSVTNRVAMKYKLYSLLGGPERERQLETEKQALRDAITEVEAHADAEDFQEIAAKISATYKFKMRKGETEWSDDFVLWQLNRRVIVKDDEINEKYRSDKRHHALDAMILSFLPNWAGDPGKNLYFGLPKGRDWRAFFEEHLKALCPERLISNPPALEESFYGARRVGQNLGAAATKRYTLRDFAYTGLNPVYSATTLLKNAKNIFDDLIRSAVVKFAETKPSEIRWQEFCEQLSSGGLKAGGPPVRRVRRIVSQDLSEFGNFSKDGGGAWRKGDGNEGWFLCERRSAPGKYSVEPVYVHQSKTRRAKEIAEAPEYLRVFGYFVKGEWVTIKDPVSDIGDPLPAGTFMIRSMKADGRIELTSIQGYEFNPISATRLIEAGLSKQNGQL